MPTAAGTAPDPRCSVLSTVGAGDSLLSGFLHAGGSGPDALRMGIAWATAAVQTPGTGIPSAGLIDPTAVEVSAIATASRMTATPPQYPMNPHQLEVSSMQVSTIQLVELDLDSSATTKDAAVDRLVAVAAAAGRASDPAQLRSDVAAREELLPTGIEGGIGIPHARSTGIDEPTVVFGRSTNGIDWGAADGPAHLVFLIAVPEGAGDEHLQILASLSRSLMKPEFRDTLLKATDPQVVVDTINAAAAPAEARCGRRAQPRQPPWRQPPPRPHRLRRRRSR